MDMRTKTLENRVRRQARRAGYRVIKSRGASAIDNLGQFMVVDASINGIVLGSRFDATLEDISAFLNSPTTKEAA